MSFFNSKGSVINPRPCYYVASMSKTPLRGVFVLGLYAEKVELQSDHIISSIFHPHLPMMWRYRLVEGNVLNG